MLLLLRVVASSLLLPPDYEAAMLVMNDSLDIFTLVRDIFREKFQVPNRPRCSFCFLTPSNPLDGYDCILKFRNILDSRSYMLWLW